MRIIPTKKQFLNWSLIGKAGYIGCILTLIMFLGWLIQIIVPQKDYSKLNYDILSKLETYNISEKQLHELHFRLSTERKEKINSEVWNEYASSILRIYKELNPNSEISLCDSIFGKITNKFRKIDISIRQKVAGQNLLLAVELHPWKTTIQESELISFNYLIQDIDASKGIIITNSEVDTNLINFAKKNYSSICSLKDTETKEWNQEITIPVIWIEVIPKFHIAYEISFKENDKIHKDILRAIFSYDYGKATFTYLDYLNYKWQNNEMPHETDSLHIYYLSTEGLKVRVNKNDWREVKKSNVYYTTDENYYLRYFEPERFRAIEDLITHEVSYTDLNISVKKYKFQELEDWIKLDKADIHGSIPKGLNLLVTANYSDLNEEDIEMKGQYIGLKK